MKWPRALAALGLVVLASALGAPRMLRWWGQRRAARGVELVFLAREGFESAEQRASLLEELDRRCALDPFGRYACARIDGERVVVSVAPPADPGELAFWLRRITSDGGVRFALLPDLATVGVDVREERRRLEDWRGANPAAPLWRFNALAPQDGGPAVECQWMPVAADDAQGAREPEVVLCGRGPRFSREFGAAELHEVLPAIDAGGRPALSIELVHQARQRLSEFSTSCLGARIAIVIDDVVVAQPVLSAAIEGVFTVSGPFSAEQRDAWIERASAGRAPVRLEFVELREPARP